MYEYKRNTKQAQKTINQNSSFVVSFVCRESTMFVNVEKNQCIPRNKLPVVKQKSQGFLGWNYNKDGSASWYDPNVDKINSDITVYAIYKLK